MSRERYVGGVIIKITEGTYNMYSGGNIVTFSEKKIIEQGHNGGIIFGEPEEYIREGKRVINIESKLYISNTEEWETPYLNVSDLLGFESSKPFIAGIKNIFGDDIKHLVIKQFMLDLMKGKVPYPMWKVHNKLSDQYGGFYLNGVIYINEKLVLDAEKDAEKSWLLFLVMIEGTGHYIDDLLRNQYDIIEGDAPGDEGTMFAADFIHFNKLLYKDFEFAKIEIEEQDGSKRIFKAKVLESTPEFKIKTYDFLYTNNKDDDHGIVTLENGEKVEVEFFKIRGAGAIHEDITKRAAKTAGVIYDYRLDEGSAWPDVPCENQSSIETCYYKTWKNMDKKGTLAYESHNGSLQYWHYMAPIGTYTNQQVKNLILNKAEEWFKEGIDPKNNTKAKMMDRPINNPYSGKKDGNDGLFYIGKILHMVQDSYSLSHTIGNDKNEITQFQGYDAQDPDKHAHPDKDSGAPGVKLAENASTKILKYYKEFKDGRITETEVLKKLKNYLNTIVYPIASGKANAKAGGTVEAYKK